MSHVSRRTFLQSSLVAGGSVAAGALGRTARIPFAQAQETADSAEAHENPYFQHSVASGDPLPDGVVIWTRVTPSADAVPGSGLGEETPVVWQVATTEGFENVVAKGTAVSSAASDHTIKIDVKGLQPNTTYYYRFAIARPGAIDDAAAPSEDNGPVFSRTGRTKTAPSNSMPIDNVKFGVCCCSNYEAGYFRGYRDMAERDELEFVVHLGDYTYEYETGGYTGTYNTQVRVVQPPNRTTTLQDYRIRLGHYHRDPDLADLHAAKPMICIWDDHEFADNVWRDGIGGDSGQPGDDYPAMKAAAMQAYFEWLPVRVAESNEGSHLYRTIGWGPLMEIIIPDLRTYRDYEIVQSDVLKTDPDFIRTAGRDGRSMLGQSQFEWFGNVLASSSTTWQVIANEVMFAPMTLPTGLDDASHDWLVKQVGLPAQGIPLNTDQWDGYMAERQKIIDLIAEKKDSNVLFVTGDIHSSWANDIPRDIHGYRTGSNKEVAATEFVTPSITANGLFDTLAKHQSLDQAARTASHVSADKLQDVAPWFKYIDFEHHGYMSVEITPKQASCHWHFVDNVLSPNTPFFQAKSFVANAGDPGAREV